MILETKRLIIRPIEISDASDIYEYAKNPNVGLWAGFSAHKSVEETKSIIETILKVDSYAIVLKEINKVIGTISLQKKLEDIYEIGYSLSEAYWNNGYMTETVRELVRYAFMKLNAYEIDSGCFPTNIGSERVLLNNRFKYLGIQEKGFLDYNNHYRDCKRFRLLRDDYMEGLLWK